MSTTCPYALLKLPYDATEQDIKQAYAGAVARLRRAIGQDGIVERLDAARAAYRLLSDPQQRERYDRSREAEASSGAATATISRRLTRLGFDGSGKVYFRIWITNLLLSFLTLGIYSAWAKVRREQYLHRHLRLDDSTFDYHGKPLAILFGRLLVVALLVVYSLARLLPPPLYALVIVAGVLLFPWMIVRSLQFRAANTSFRGLRFSFRGSYREALATYLGYGLLTLLSFGLTLPLLLWRQKKFLITNLGYGAHVFGFYATRRMFYRALWLPTLLVFLPFGAILAVLAVKGIPFLVGFLMVLVFTKAIAPLGFAALLAFQLLIVPYARMAALNVAWSNTRVDGVRMDCTLGFGGYAATHVSNWLLTLLSVGLFWPWAVVRTIRYRARHFSLDSAAALDGLLGGRPQSASAVGGEATAALGMDVGL